MLPIFKKNYMFVKKKENSLIIFYENNVTIQNSNCSKEKHLFL